MDNGQIYQTVYLHTLKSLEPKRNITLSPKIGTRSFGPIVYKDEFMIHNFLP